MSTVVERSRTRTAARVVNDKVRVTGVGSDRLRHEGIVIAAGQFNFIVQQDEDACRRATLGLLRRLVLDEVEHRLIVDKDNWLKDDFLVCVDLHLKR